MTINDHFDSVLYISTTGRNRYKNAQLKCRGPLHILVYLV